MKKILALLLSFLIIFPSLSTAALDLNEIVKNNDIKLEEAIDNNLVDENVDSTLENTEEAIILDEVTPEETIILEEVNPEETIILEEVNPEDNVLQNEEVENNTIVEEEIENKEIKVDELQVNKILIGEIYKKKEKHLTNQIRKAYGKNNIYEEEQFNLKSKSIEDETILENKTEENYEVVLAYSDGNYSYLNSSDSMNEALSIINNIKPEELEANVLPSIINNSGQVVYSTNSMARILKHINGNVYGYFDINTDLYSDANLTNFTAYINQGYVDDAPIIQDTGKAALIQVGGTKAWINNDSSKGNNEIIVVPLNQVTNPSYYSVNNGILTHFITSNIKGTVGYGTSINVGKAPSDLKEGVKYYSYDEKYFYKELNQLIIDLKGNTNVNAVNSNNAYYNYYKNLPFRSTTTYTAQELNNFIKSNTIETSKLRGIGESVINAQNKYGVNGLLMIGVAINESNWGKSSIAQEKNNIFGLNAVDSDPYLEADEFNTVKDSINDFAKNWISRAYADPQNWTYFGGHLGNKLSGANIKYASDPFWGEKAASYAFEIDRQLGGKDYDLYQLAIFKSNNEVKGLDGKYLYNVKLESPVVIMKDNSSNGSYEIFADRTTPLSTGRFEGTYDWAYKGKISSANSLFINTRRNEGELTKGVSYQTHVQDYGWQDWQNNGELSGTTGQAKRLEGISIMFNNTIQGASISYQTHVQDYGWQEWKKDGQLSGTTGEAKRLEAIRINLDNAPGYKVEYRVHVQNDGWQEWKSNGEIAGTEGEAKRLEAIEVRVVKDISLQYRTHVQNDGWQNFKNSGEVSGTTGEAKRVEAIELKLTDAPIGANIVYQTHVQDYGWQDWKRNGQMSGTSGEAKRLEAIRINLENSPGYKVEYRVHVQNDGWQGWKSNGEIAGTTGEGKRIEAIEVRLVKK